MEEITDLHDPRIHPDKVQRMRSGARQEFRLNGQRGFESIYFITPPERHFYLDIDGDGWKWVNGCAECNGEPRDWMTYVECEKHNVCAHCRTPRADLKEAPWGRKHGWVCKPCADIEHEREKADALEAMPECSDDYDFMYLDDIKCPYCAFAYNDSSEHYDDDNEKHECPRCDNDFMVTAEASVTFNCMKIKEGDL